MVRKLLVLPVLLLSACGQHAAAPGGATSGPSLTPTATATATEASITQITVSGAVNGAFLNPVSTCNQAYPVTNDQTTVQVSAAGQVQGHPAEIHILDPAGPADYESQGYAIFYFHQSPDATYGWTAFGQGTSPNPNTAATSSITSFNPKTGATFSVTLGANMQFSSAAQPWDSARLLTVAGKIVCH